uniref:Uncharacterized protein n=1 Tax=Nelumbo nucifera TaxID=4432 RepID=A0A822Y413_NELNU|nr:TPA_asm: hypothetical protein HUJ06_027819 [Nelumbo nucifera]
MLATHMSHSQRETRITFFFHLINLQGILEEIKHLYSAEFFQTRRYREKGKKNLEKT